MKPEDFGHPVCVQCKSLPSCHLLFLSIIYFLNQVCKVFSALNNNLKKVDICLYLWSSFKRQLEPCQVLPPHKQVLW